MPRFICPHCKSPIKVTDERLAEDRPLSCPKCHEAFSPPEQSGSGWSDPLERNDKLSSLSAVGFGIILFVALAFASDSNGHLGFIGFMAVLIFVALVRIWFHLDTLVALANRRPPFPDVS